VVIVSAGNDGAANPNDFASNLANAGGGNVIIAGSIGVPVNGDPAQGVDLNQISSFSNQAGRDAARYLAALGYRVRAPDHTGAQFLWSGTSFSAPVISGAAALLASAFPEPHGCADRHDPVNSADDIGAAGTDATFGRGRLNIARAFQPQGATKLAGASPVPLSGSSNGTLSGPMGDASPSMKGAIILDGFDRAYALDIAQTLDRVAAERPLEDALQPGVAAGRSAIGATSVSISVRRNLTGPSQLEIAQTGLGEEDARRARVVAGSALSRLTPRTAAAFGFSQSGHSLQQRLTGRGNGAFLIAQDPAERTGFTGGNSGSLGLRHDLGIAGVTVTAEQGEVRQQGERRQFELVAPDVIRPGYSKMAVTADRSFGDLHATLGVTRLQEEATVLGARFGFAPGGSATTFVDTALRYDLSRNWGIEGRYRNGWTQLPGGSGFVQGGSMASNGWAVDLWRRNAVTAGDLVSLRVTQPLRVRSGGYRLNLPVAYDYADGSVDYSVSEFSLAPKGREVAFEAAYLLPLFDGAGSLSANTFYRMDPGHVAAALDDVGAAVRFSLDF
jgi:hypothetical protein